MQLNLNLCWWNIGISPPIKKQKSNKKSAIELACGYIKTISSEKCLDLIALCEVSEDEAIDFSKVANELEMEYLDLSDTVGRIILDFSIMYESSKLEFISKKNLVHHLPTGKNIRVGVRVVFKVFESGRYLTIFLSHWPSKRSSLDRHRSAAAQSMRVHIDKIIERYGVESQFICMGDYNTEPYSEPMTNQLYATRDYHLIQDKRSLIFNPSWFLFSDKRTNNIGTYRHQYDEMNRWYVLDQMLFSSSFLYGNDDCLKLDMEALDFLRVWQDDGSCTDDLFAKNFDHYPIFSKVHHGKKSIHHQCNQRNTDISAGSDIHEE